MKLKDLDIKTLLIIALGVILIGFIIFNKDGGNDAIELEIQKKQNEEMRKELVQKDKIYEQSMKEKDAAIASREKIISEIDGKLEEKAVILAQTELNLARTSKEKKALSLIIKEQEEARNKMLAIVKNMNNDELIEFYNAHFLTRKTR